MHYVIARFVHATHCSVEIAVFTSASAAQDLFRTWAGYANTRDVTLTHSEK